MGEDQTQYGVLTIAGLVAIAAILSMGMHAESPNNALTGAVTSTAPTTIAEQAQTTRSDELHNLPPYSRMDYTREGTLSPADAQLLADYIATNECPQDRVCDINQDGVVDERDLALFNKLLRTPPSEFNQGDVPQPPQEEARTPTGQATTIVLDQRANPSVATRLA